MIPMKWILLFLLYTAKSLEQQPPTAEPGTCTWEDCGKSDHAATHNFETMRFSMGDIEHTFDAYVQPDIALAYNATAGSIPPVETSFRGQFGKFVNLSPKPIRVFWKPNTNKNSEATYISDIGPFGVAGTATYPGHHFIACPADDINTVLIHWTIVKKTSLYKYDPYDSIQTATKHLSEDQLKLYKLQYESLAFSKFYQRRTGREYLALWPKKKAPRYPIWEANAFGETHTVVTKQKHIINEVPHDIAHAPVAAPTAETKKKRALTATEEQLEALKIYQSDEPTLTLNLTVLSVAPKVFEIRNFLSQEEINHILEVATGMKFGRSTTRAGDIAEAQADDATRTSRNSWVPRTKSIVVDMIYRRAADLLRIDEALLRFRSKEEQAVFSPGRNAPICERLQLVHYDIGQQYTPHHDFQVPDVQDGQATRFATVLFYLNDGMGGGETSFPRWLNGNTTEVLKVTPEAGKAILFYNQLPDGNYDERSQHAALPITSSEKWLTNLWVWDPFMV